MKKRRFVLTGFLAFSLVLSLLSGVTVLLTAPSAPAQQTMAQATEYVIRSDEDSICVYRNGELVLDTGISPAGLPRQDREALARGLTVTTGDELQCLLEDFSS